MEDPMLQPELAAEGPRKGGLVLDPALEPQGAPEQHAPSTPAFRAALARPPAQPPTTAAELSGSQMQPLSEPASAATKTEIAPVPLTTGTTGTATRSGSPASSLHPIVYGALSAACAAMALLLLLAPNLTARLMFNKSAATPLDAQHSQLLRLNGGALLAEAAAAAALALAPGNGWARIGASASDLLRLALAGQGLANTLLCLYYWRSIQPINMLAELAANGAFMALPAADLLAKGYNLRRSLPGQMRGLITPRAGSLMSGAYLLLALLLPLLGVALFYAPWYTLFHFFGYSYGASTFLLAKMVGVADMATIPVALLLLKDAAEKRVLSSPVARTLNAGILLSGLVHMAVLLPVLAKGPGGWMLPVNVATWLMATLISAAGLLSGSGLLAKGRATVEGVAEEVGGKDE